MKQLPPSAHLWAGEGTRSGGRAAWFPLLVAVSVPALVLLILMVPARVAGRAPEETADSAPPVSISGSTTLLAEWRVDNRNGRPNDDDFGNAIMRTNLLLERGDIRLSTRIDGEGFVSRPPGVDRRNDLRFERVALEVFKDIGTTGAYVSATLGDFYAQFGHGLVLSLRRVDELGLDVTARGGRVDVGMSSGVGQLTLLAGFSNPVNIERQQLRYTEDPADPIVGGRLEVRPVDLLSLGVHAAGARLGSIDNADEQTLSYGGTVDATAADVTLALEMDGQHRRVLGVERQGWALYGSATTLWAQTTLLAEFKHYSSFEPLRGSQATYLEDTFRYSFPPTAERIDQEVTNDTNITGGRLRADVRLSAASTSTVFGNLGWFLDRSGIWLAHGFGGVDKRWDKGRALLLSGGYRREWLRQDGQLLRAIAHAELDWIEPLKTGWALHAIVQHQSHVEQFGGGEPFVFHRGNSSLEIDFHGRWLVGGGFDWNNERRADEIRKFFGFGYLRYRPSADLIFQGLAGAQRGGIRCLAGACRNFPPFAGVRLDMTARF